MKNTKLIIEKMKLSDFDALRALWGESGLHLASYARGKHELDLLIRFNTESCIVAKNNETIIGTAIGAFNGKRAWIYHVAVGPKWQKKGIGSVLLKHVEEILKKKGATKIFLGIAFTNLKVAPFYSKHGYTVMNDAFVMEKDIYEEKQALTEEGGIHEN